jgi:LAS superfamily LD-carboxypeptidase LdcB
VTAWNELQSEAAQAGYSMSIVSAYRSVEDQRVLFLSRLNEAGASIVDVINGTADELITSVLVTSSIPGYSKHHTGYTLDLACAGYAFEQFRDSPCYVWMSENNYENAKRFGFIPSYPADADLQGPDPEAWEYVWVGLEVVQN